MKLLQTKDYLLLIDEEAEIKEGDYGFSEQFHDSSTPTIVTIMCLSHKIELELKKVTAYYPLTKEAKELNLLLLPNPFEVDIEEEFNRVDDEKIRYSTEESLEWSAYKIGFSDGYKAAQSKQFTLEDMKKAIEMAREEYTWTNQGREGSTEWYYSKEQIIQSLSTQQLPKEFIPEYINTNSYGSETNGYDSGNFISKTITNSEGKEELVGTYKY